MNLYFKKHIHKTAIISTLILIFGIGVIEIGVLLEYGWTVFILLPFLIGFLPSFMITRVKNANLWECYRNSFLTLFLSISGLLLFAIEGLICIAMALPIAAPLVWLGAYLGHLTNKSKWSNPTNSTLGILIICLSTMSFDYINESPRLTPVSTKVIVNTDIETAWQNVIRFDTIVAPDDWIFSTGISYPTDATIKGKGVGAVRHCNFTTGSFVEPITTWNQPNLLQFDVASQPTPMNELNPFWDVHPPHLEGYFVSEKGQFKLTEISKNKTEIEGTTWYRIDITPVIYWKTWSDFIIHKIHLRVLNHIKKVSENS
ncbi:hypothetical protein [Brumimicrobium aurantiacum]|uniref:SRPBCC family protein n=1 Tax=Brumimicrobium aurantiacum TaxID=1737063 RepID=A0A3E1EUX4_9FLAO|nr:hypothetical protein [Brumimicrobium aurantiacum]RFC53364.1 hypothetical protein DXU93_13100 [Brumimicrobium aurantiacum]